MADHKEVAPPTHNPLVLTELGATEAQIAAAFTEWDRRFRDDPDRFYSEAHHLLKGNPRDYGEACAPYFLAILEQLNPSVDVNG